MATWTMMAALAPIPSLAPHRALSGRHLWPLPIDEAHLARLGALMRPDPAR
jgi:hypothetical protein